MYLPFKTALYIGFCTSLAYLCKHILRANNQHEYLHEFFMQYFASKNCLEWTKKEELKEAFIELQWFFLMMRFSSEKIGNKLKMSYLGSCDVLLSKRGELTRASVKSCAKWSDELLQPKRNCCNCLCYYCFFTSQFKVRLALMDFSVLI